MRLTLLLTCIASLAMPAEAIIWRYGDFDTSAKTCSLVGWSGSEPSSGKLTVPSSYKHTDGTTYTVVKIGGGALCNLSTVTDITIPASILTIGKLSSGSYISGSCQNFLNCPKLARLTVDTANPRFASTGAGILYFKGGEHLIKVPQNLAVTNGTLTVTKKTSTICMDAFAGNSTIKTLVIPDNTTVLDNGGLNSATSLAEVQLAVAGGAQLLTLSNGALISVGEKLICMPPASPVTSYTVPAGVTVINHHAFANTRNLRSIDLTGVTDIKSFSFINSGLTSVTIPATATLIGDEVFSGCKSLASIHFNTSDTYITKGFARGCTSLTSVTTDTPFTAIDEAAFKNCSSLTDFPFTGHTNTDSDSIFFGSGLKQVVYDNAPNTSIWNGTAMFEGCRRLEVIDASAITGTYDEEFIMGEAFAASCMNLAALKLPDFAAFSYSSSGPDIPAFGYSCAITRFEIASLSNAGGCVQFCYSPSAKYVYYTPDVFVHVTANRKYGIDPLDYNTWPLGTMFSATNGATVSPRVYCDSYSPANNYVVKTATYYVPGATAQNYSAAESAGALVLETYSLETWCGADGYLRARITPRTGNFAGKTITDIMAGTDAGGMMKPDANGEVKFNLRAGTTESLVVTYKIDGVEMSTVYPSEFWLTSGTAEAIAGKLGVDLQQRMMLITGATGTPSWHIFSTSGCAVASGTGTCADLGRLAQGMYIVVATDSAKSVTQKIYL